MRVLLISSISIAQVGFDNPNPHSSAILDLSGANNTTKGLIIPKVDTAKVVRPRADGLMVYDTIKQAFFFWKSNAWYTLNPVTVKNNGDAYTLNSLAIGKVSASTALDLNGDINSNGKITALSMHVQGFSQNALMPTGGIIMWSGTTLPTGWALCDGKNGTPNLAGRFIVGYDKNALNGYENPGNLSERGNTPGSTGGLETVSLTKTQLPKHTHGAGTMSTTEDGSHTHKFSHSGDNDLDHQSHHPNARNYPDVHMPWSDMGMLPAGNHTHSVIGDTENGTSDGLNGEAHENRPPYYVLAFIIKL